MFVNETEAGVLVDAKCLNGFHGYLTDFRRNEDVSEFASLILVGKRKLDYEMRLACNASSMLWRRFVDRMAKPSYRSILRSR